MSGEDDFRIRPGRIRSTRAQASRPFIAQALAAELAAKETGELSMLATDILRHLPQAIAALKSS